MDATNLSQVKIYLLSETKYIKFNWFQVDDRVLMTLRAKHYLSQLRYTANMLKYAIYLYLIITVIYIYNTVIFKYKYIVYATMSAV